MLLSHELAYPLADPSKARRSRRAQRGRRAACGHLRRAAHALLVTALCAVVLTVISGIAIAAHPDRAGAATATARPFTGSQLLTNPSFEHGTAGWSIASGQAVADYPGRAAQGSDYLETNTGSAGSGGSIWQNTTSAPLSGQGYQGIVELRSPTGTSVSVTVALWAVGGTNPVARKLTTVTLSSATWKRVPVELDVPATGYTSLKFQVYVNSVGPNVDLDAASLENAGLRNTSFTASTSSWAFTSNTNQAIYGAAPSASAPEDGWYLQTNVSTPGAGFSQSAGGNLVDGHSYRAQVMLRAPGPTVKGTVSLAATGGPGTQTHTQAFTVGSTWKLVPILLTVTATGHTGIRFGVSLSTTNTNLDVDDVTLGDSGVLNPWFGDSSHFKNWSTTGSENVAVYAATAARPTTGGADYLETNAASSGGSIYQDVSSALVNGRSYQGSLLLRSPTGAPVTVALALWAMGTGMTSQGGSTTVTISSTQWTTVSADLDVAAAGYSDIRFQLDVKTPGVNVDADQAYLTPPPPPSPPSPVTAKIVSEAQSQIGVWGRDECNPYAYYWGIRTPGECAAGRANISWCSYFAAWVWKKAGAPVTWGDNGGQDIDGWSYSWYTSAVARGTWHNGPNNDPQVGDVAVWGTFSDGGYGQHAGIVVGVKNGLIDVVSGNTGGADPDVSITGWVNPATFTEAGYGLLGYDSPTGGATTAAAKAAALKAAAAATPKLSPSQVAQRIAAQPTT